VHFSQKLQDLAEQEGCREEELQYAAMLSGTA